MKIYLDTNIIMDWCDKTRPGNPFAKTILSSARPDTYELYVSTQSIIDCAYSLRKLGVQYEDFSELFRVLRTITHIVGIDELDLLWALEHYSGDFEDDMQYASAYSNVCDFFITRDKALFSLNDKECPMTVITPEDFVAKMTED